TPTDKLICEDPRLTALDVKMVEAYEVALARLQAPLTRELYRDAHLAWLKAFARTCNALGEHREALRECVAAHLSGHTTELNALGRKTPDPNPWRSPKTGQGAHLKTGQR